MDKLQAIQTFVCIVEIHVVSGVAGTRTACLEGLGLGRFLSYQVDAFVRKGRLEVLLEEFEPPPVPVSLVHAHERLVPTRVRAVVDWLSEHLSQRLRR